MKIEDVRSGLEVEAKCVDGKWHPGTVVKVLPGARPHMVEVDVSIGNRYGRVHVAARHVRPWPKDQR